MPTFSSNPLHSHPVHRLLKKHPSLFGVPFLLIMVGASFGLESFAQTRYDLHSQKVTQVRFRPAHVSLYEWVDADGTCAGDEGAGARAEAEPQEVRHPGGVLRASAPYPALLIYNPTLLRGVEIERDKRGTVGAETHRAACWCPRVGRPSRRAPAEA